MVILLCHWTNGKSQIAPCNCSPVLDIFVDQCKTIGASTDISYFVYDEDNASSSHHLALFINGAKIYEKTITLDQNGFYSESTPYKFYKDSDILIEFQCEQTGCISSKSLHLETMPEFELLVQNVSCNGVNDGVIAIANDATSLVDIVWESGEKKKDVRNLAPGKYPITIYNITNSCKNFREVEIKTPSTLDAKFHTFHIGCDNGNAQYLKATIRGGTSPYVYDWDDNGLNGYDDNDKIVFNSYQDFTLKIKDKNGCALTAKATPELKSVTNYSVKDGEVNSTELIDNNKYLFDLMQAANIKNGDIDQDGLDGSLYNITFYKNQSDADNQQNALEYIYAAQPGSTVIARIENFNECVKTASVSLATPQFCLVIKEACDNDGIKELIPQTCIDPVTSLAPGGVWEAFEIVNTTEQTLPVSPLVYIDDKVYFDPQIVGEGNFRIYYTPPGGERQFAAFDVQAVNPQLYPYTDVNCGNTPIIYLIANPNGGDLVGPNILGQNSNGLYMINTAGLIVGTPYNYSYTYNGSFKSGLICSKEVSTQLTLAPFPVIDIVNVPASLCYEDRLSLDVNVSASEEVTYEWYTPSNRTVPFSRLKNPEIVDASETGYYLVKVIQENGCFAVDSEYVEVITLPSISCAVDASVTCFGGSNARAEVEVVDPSGIGGYSIEWSNGSTDFIQNELSAGKYFVTVTNNRGCKDTCSVLINTPPAFNIDCTHGINSVDCFGALNGSNTISATGGTPPYTFSLDGTVYASNNIFNNLSSDAYTVYIKDFNNCVDSCKFEISQPEELTCNLTPVDLSCFMANDGIVSAFVTGGVEPYRYIWNTGATSSEIKGLPAGNYSVTIYDAKNCSSICDIILTQPGKINSGLLPTDVCLDFDKIIATNISRTEGSYIDNTKENHTYDVTWSLSQSAHTVATGAVDTNLVFGASDESIKFNTYCLKEGTANILVHIEDQNGCDLIDSTAVNIASCVDLALRKSTIGTGVRYTGETVGHLIEVYNQGTIAVKDILIRDIVPTGYIFHVEDNTTIITGNPYEWELNPDGLYITKIDQLLPGDSKNLKIFLRIADDYSGNLLVNRAEIFDFYSIISDSKVKHNPVDEDDFNNDISRQNEVDDELCDSNNTDPLCNQDDNEFDEDKSDFDIVTLCTLEGTFFDESACVTSNLATATFNINSIDLSKFDPNGDGDGSSADGDAGNLVDGIYNSYFNAMMGEKAITGSIKFTTANIASNGMLLGNGDLLINTEDDIKLFARLVSLENCVAVSNMNLDFNITAPIISEPISVVSLLNDNDVCFEVSVSPDVEDIVEYQWQILQNGVFTDIPGAIEADYCIPVVTEAYDNAEFKVLIRDIKSTNEVCTQASQVARLELEGDPKLACLDLIRVSLDDDCLALITANMVLADDRFSDRINIVIKDENGVVINNPINSATIGNTYTVYAIDSTTGNSCWSEIYVEDKLPPVISCPNDITTTCANGNPLILDPTFYDSCDPTAVLTKIKDISVDLACGDDFIAYRELTYTAEDIYNNVSAPCVFRIYFEPLDTDDITMPSNIEISCSTYNWDTNGNNYPDVKETGIPTYNGYELAIPNVNDITKLLSNNNCRINIQFTDTEIPLCGDTYKILRSFNVLNWCSGAVRTHNQIIKIYDDILPQMICGSSTPYQKYTEKHKCTADFTVPEPIVTDCNTTSWSINYKVQDKYGNFDENQPFINDNVVNYSGVTSIVDLPIGLTLLQYTVEDACGNVSSCTAMVNIIDTETPVPVCDEITVISLDQNGSARLFAKTIDDGSHDNCTDLTYSIRRMSNYCSGTAPTLDHYNGNVYHEYVDFCCNDQSVPNQQVELLVSDQSGNKNVCMANIEIQNKTVPIITCPINTTVDCSDDTSISAHGSATFEAGCDIYYITQLPDNISEYSCGEKRIARTWQVKTNIGNTTVASCTQYIDVKNLTPFDLNTVTFPTDVVLVNKCNTPGDFGPNNPSTGGYPTYDKVGCSQVAISFNDQVFDVVEDACFKILRKWTVIDWCTFDEDDEDSYVTHTQVIKIIDTEKPTPVCQTKEFFVDQNCQSTVSFEGEGSDTCTPKNELEFSWILTDSAGDKIKSGSSKYVNSILNLGEYKVEWTLEDKCGNISVCDQILHVKDTILPNPYCISDITTVLMPSTLNIALWAMDYDRGATDNCTENVCITFGKHRPVDLTKVHYYKFVNGQSVIATEAEYLKKQAELWDPVLKSSSRIFDCDDLGLQEIDIVVWDESGNYNYCTVKIRIQDNSGKCGQSKPASISGLLTTPQDIKIIGNEVVANIIENNEPFSTKTQESGVYTFEYLPSNNKFKVAPTSPDDYMNGVSTLDLVYLQRHILNIEPFDKWFQFTAADVNNDKKVTVADISEVRKVLLGILPKFTNNDSWRYHYGASPLDPYVTENHIMIDALDGEIYRADFTGIKVADLNGSANGDVSQVNVLGTDSRKAPVTLSIQKSNNSENAIELLIDPNSSLLGLQMELALPKHMTVTSLIGHDVSLSDDNYHIINADNNNLIRIISTEVIGNTGKLLTINFENDIIFRDLEDIRFSTQYPQMIVNRSLEEDPLELRLNHQSVESNFIVYQNTPNPYKSMTSVKLFNPTTSLITVQVIDFKGSKVYESQKVYEVGEHILNFNTRDHHLPNGVMYLRISNDTDTKVIKMIQLE